jgi:YegS/Rv2252/BmrU family lipid kinase
VTDTVARRPPGDASRHAPAEPPRTTATTLIIWNPGAGGGGTDAHEVAEGRSSIETTLAKHGIDAELYESASEADTDRRVEAALATGVRSIVAAGGDGTVRSVAFRLLGTETALGVLPLGTAMNVARSLGIPLDLDGAAAVLASGNTRSIDVGEARGRPFLEVASIGLGAEVLEGATDVGEGRVREALAILRRAVRSPRTRVRMQLDGREVRGRAPSIAVANGPFTGRGLELAPQARIGDGRFDVLLFEGFGPWQLGLHLVRVLLGRPHDARIRRYRAATVRISSHRPLPVRLDSQDVGSTPVEIVTRPGALTVIAPPEGEAPAREKGRQSTDGSSR